MARTMAQRSSAGVSRYEASLGCAAHRLPHSTATCLPPCRKVIMRMENSERRTLNAERRRSNILLCQDFGGQVQHPTSSFAKASEDRANVQNPTWDTERRTLKTEP